MGRRPEAGFTLVELLVVVLLLGILTTMATPKFLTARDGAAETVARSDLTAAAKVQTLALLHHGAYVGDAAGLTALEPELHWMVGDTPHESGAVYAHVPAPTADELYLSARTAAGGCWYVHLTPSATRYGHSPACPAAAGASAPAYADAW